MSVNIVYSSISSLERYRQIASCGLLMGSNGFVEAIMKVGTRSRDPHLQDILDLHETATPFAFSAEFLIQGCSKFSSQHSVFNFRLKAHSVLVIIQKPSSALSNPFLVNFSSTFSSPPRSIFAPRDPVFQQSLFLSSILSLC